MPPDATCIHGAPLAMTEEEQCQPCIDLIAEEVRRNAWLEGLDRYVKFFHDHRDFIPTAGVRVMQFPPFGAPPADSRTAVFDLIEATGPVTREAAMAAPDRESYVETTSFYPHKFVRVVPNESIGENVTKPTKVWNWDAAIFGEVAR